MGIELNKHFILLITAAPNSGKSYTIKYIVSDLVAVKKQFKAVIVFTMSPHDYQYLPEGYVHTTYSDAKLQQIINFQNEHRDEKFDTLIIFDDFRGLVDNIHNNKLLSSMLTRHRHLNVSMIFSMQYVHFCSPTIREIAQYYIVFQQYSMESVKALHSCAGYRFERVQQFKKYLDDNLGDYKFLFINLRAKNKNDLYRVMKAPVKLPDYKLKY